MPAKETVSQWTIYESSCLVIPGLTRIQCCSYGQFSWMPDLIGNSKCDSDDICTSVITWDYQGAAIPGRLWKEVNSGGSFSEYLYHSDGNVNTID